MGRPSPTAIRSKLAVFPLQSAAVTVLVIGALFIELSHGYARLADALPASFANAGEIILAFITGLARIPWVQLQLLAASPEAWAPAMVASVVIVVAGVAEDAYRHEPRARRGLTVLMMTVGIVALAWFLRFGAIDWNQGPDWRKEWTYYTALKEAVAVGELPWTLRGQFQETDQYLANPETVFAPHVIALRWLSIRTFMLAQLLCYCAAGLWCLLRLSQELRFGVLSSLMFLMLFLLNGHLLSHLAQGHGQWVAYLLLPCVFLLIHRAAKGEVARGNQTKLALVLTAMLAAGGWHVFVWCATFIGAFVLVRLDAWRFAAGVAIMTLGLSAFRILPAAIVFAGERNEFLGSFDSLSLFVAALIGGPRPLMNGLNWWEFDTFVGWIGFIVFCWGVTVPLTPSRSRHLDCLWATSATMIGLGFYEIYRVSLFQLPGLSSERVTSRLVIVGVLGFVLLGCLQLNAWLQSSTAPWRRALVGFATLAMALQLVVRAEAGRPAGDRDQPPPVDVIRKAPPEPLYRTTVFGGLAISLVAAGVALRTLRPAALVRL